MSNPRAQARSRKVRVRGRFRLGRVLGLLLLAMLPARAGRAQLIPGVESWADATVGLSTTKWRGPRVPYPVPRARPVLSTHVDSRDWPLTVHAPASLPATDLARFVRAAEEAYLSLHQAGFLSSFGDAGQGGTSGRDLYVVEGAERGASAALDASGNFSALDGARAFALLDARLPRAKLLACAAQALMEAELYELDPAESAAVRTSSAAYYAYLLSGEFGCDDDATPRAEASPFGADESATGAAWLARLGAREDRGRGIFLYDMWQFARQRTWEGRDLRASPDLLEAIAKALELRHEPFGKVAAELAAQAALAGEVSVRTLPFRALPASLSGPPLAPLGSRHLRVELSAPRPGTRLRVWATASPGARFALAAARIDARGAVLARLDAPVRADPVTQLSVELDAQTRAVQITVTNVDDGLPDPDTLSEVEPRTVALTIDARE